MKYSYITEFANVLLNRLCNVILNSLDKLYDVLHSVYEANVIFKGASGIDLHLYGFIYLKAECEL